MDIYSNNVQQNVPIISDAQIEPLIQVEFETEKNDSKSGYAYKKNLYTANDGDFLSYFERLTKRKRDKLLEELGLESDWTNSDRLYNRLLIMSKFKKDIKPSVVKEKKDNVVPKKMKKQVKKTTFNILDPLSIKFTVKKNFYTASDEEFVKFLMIATKSSKERVLKGVGDLNLQTRLFLIDRFKVSIISAMRKGITI